MRCWVGFASMANHAHQPANEEESQDNQTGSNDRRKNVAQLSTRNKCWGVATQRRIPQCREPLQPLRRLRWRRLPRGSLDLLAHHWVGKITSAPFAPGRTGGQ